MTILDNDTIIGRKIESLVYEEKEVREYMGASLIGDLCIRRAWYTYRWYKTIYISARLKRLFGRGNQEELVLIEELKKAGVEIIGTQKRGSLFGGHISGHYDGELINVPDAPKTKHVLECKTANEKNFTKFKNNGAKKGSFQYYVQFQIYMHMYKIKRTLFVVTNKNTDERYYERIKYNKKDALQFIAMGVDIINSKYEPRRLPIGQDWLCPYCNYKDICKSNGKVKTTCRSCIRWEPIDGGKWLCKLKNKELTIKQQLKACKKYERL